MSGRAPLCALRAAGPVAPGMWIGLYGGSFNPPHSGHAHVAHTALVRFGLDAVWVLVSPQNPLKSATGLAPYAERLARTRALLSGPRIHVSGLEADIGARFTVETLSILRARFPDVRFVLTMGADSFAGLHQWRDWRRLAALAPIAVVARPGWTLRAMTCPAARAIPRRDPRALAVRGAPGWAFAGAPFNAESSSAIRARG